MRLLLKHNGISNTVFLLTAFASSKAAPFIAPQQQGL
jgi:hypothetical protein